jgi:hypothetical protein
MVAIGSWVGGRCGIDMMNRELCSLLQSGGITDFGCVYLCVGSSGEGRRRRK